MEIFEGQPLDEIEIVILGSDGKEHTTDELRRIDSNLFALKTSFLISSLLVICSSCGILNVIINWEQ